ncbi:MAG: hypothetical protein ACO2PN_14725 [Pyrobaculum sp.]|jgi:hypothetical protein
MSRPLLTVAVLLLLATVAAANATVNCTKTGEYRYDTTESIEVGLRFRSIAPRFPGDAAVFNGELIYANVYSVQWNRQLDFGVNLEVYAPNQHWVVSSYRCVYNRSGNVDVRDYNVLEGRPERRRITVTLTVPATAARYETSTFVRVSQPLSGSYCSALPSASSWPNCPAASIDPNKLVSVDYPRSWQALQVNGRRPGDVVAENGVNATIPNPLEYAVYSHDVGSLSRMWIDFWEHGYDAGDVPVSIAVILDVVGMPRQWGTVRLRGASVPLYIDKPVISSDVPTSYCRPPSCVVLAWANLTTSCKGHDVPWDVHYLYVALVAVQTGVTLEENVAFEPSGPTVRLPLGSVIKLTLETRWLPSSIAGPPRTRPYLHTFRDPTYYEEVARRGKINGPLPAPWPKSAIAFAVDEFVRSIELDVYARPGPYYNTVGLLTGVYLCRDLWQRVYIEGPVWLTEAMLRNHPDISRGRYLDLLHLLYGYPTTYYWGSGDQYGMVSVRTERRYEQTTADSAGSYMLYHVTGVMPTDSGVLHIPSTYQFIGGSPNQRPPPPSPWLVALVPTAACRTMFCTSLSPELLGPIPPFPGDRALPNMGYSIMLMYIGNSSRHRVKVYIEDGYVISSGPPIDVTRAHNYKLVEIDKEWRPLEVVVVGPGWWVPLRQLDACGSMPVRASSIYATPDRLGPVRIIVEDNGRNSTYIFYVTNDVGYRITTRTPAPESTTGTPFNITAYITLGGVPYYHAVYGYGEGGRLSPPACVSTQFNINSASQLALSGDFWGSFGLAHMPLKPVNIQYIHTKPRLELVEPWRGLVRVRADGPVAGFAFYAQRNGAWVKIGEAAGSCLLVNASRLFPWDPILVLPLVEQVLDAAPGSTVTIWRPETALLFKTWADVVGYPKGARSVLAVVRTC